MVCPNINTTEWKLLEKQVGTKEAYRVFAANGNEIPVAKQPARVKKDTGLREIVSTRGAIDDARNTMVHYNLENNTSHFIEAEPVARGFKLGLVLNYLPFGVFEQMKLDSPNRNFIETIPIKGAKVVQLNVNFKVNPIDTESIADQLEKEKATLVDAATPMRHRVFDGMYALNTQDSVEASEQLTSKLTEILQKHGVQVRNGIENLKSRKGQDIVAVADLVNNMILVAKGTRDSQVLPEEASHFIIGTMDTESEIYKQLMTLVESTPEYTEVVEKYTEEYEGDVVALKEEALGKLLAKQLIKINTLQEATATDPKIIRLLKNLWRRLKRAMAKIVYPKYLNSLEALLGKTAEGVLNDQAPVNNTDKTSVRQREMYDIKSGMTEVSTTKTMGEVEGQPEDDRQQVVVLEDRRTITELVQEEREPLRPEEKARIEIELRKLVNNMIAQLEKRKARVKAISSRDTKEIKLEQDRIRQLEKNLDEATFLAAITRYLEQALQDINGKSQQVPGKHRTLPTTIHYKGALQALADIEQELKEGTVQDINEVARKIHDINGFIVSYKENVQEMVKLMDDLRLFDEQSAFIGAIETYILEVNAKIDEVENKYYDIGANIFSKFLGDYLGNRNKTDEMEKLDIKKALKQAEKDIGFFSLWANGMAESGDDILKLIASAVKSAKYTGQYEARLDQKDMLEAQEKLEAAGIKDVRFVYEQDDEGGITGNLTSQHGVNYQAFYDARKIFMESLGPRLNREDFNTEAEFTTELSERTAKVAKWYKENTELVPGAEDMMEHKKRELSDFNYTVWEDLNLQQTLETLVPTNRSELRMPKKSKYADTTYANLNAAEKEFLDEIWRIKRKNDDKMNPKFVRPQQAPMIRKDMIETIKSARSAADAKKGLKRIKEHFVRTEDDTDFGGQLVEQETDELEESALKPGERYVLTDVRGRLVRFLPVFFTKRLKDMKDLSLDIVATMSAHSAMTNDYHEMEKIIHLLEVGKDYITDKRQVPINEHWFEAITGRRNEQGKKIKQKAMKEPGSDSIAKRLEGFFDMQVYGNYKKDEGTILGGLDTAKLVDAMGSYVAINNLALNVYAGFANVIFGSANIRIEAAAAQFFDHKDLMAADKMYTKGLPGMLGDIGKRNKTSKLALFTEFFDTLQDFEQDMSSMNSTRRTRMSQLATMSSLFFMNHMGEHYMQTRTALAMANKIKLTDRAGNEVNLYDAMEVRGNKLVLKAEFEGQFTVKDNVKFRKRMDGVNQSLHGIYNNLDKSYMQQRSYLRLVLMFRKFMIPAINRRYGKKTYNYQLDAVTEGYYRATWSFMTGLYRDIKQGEFSISKNWNDLNEREKANFMRTFYEVAYMLAFLALANILMGLADDDDDNWVLNMLAYQARRVFTEFAAYVPLPGFMPSEGLRIIKSPAAVISQLTTLNNALIYAMPWKWGETMQSGQYKGWSKFSRYGVDLVPLHKTIKGWQTPEEKLKFFSQPVY